MCVTRRLETGGVALGELVLERARELAGPGVSRRLSVTFGCVMDCSWPAHDGTDRQVGGSGALLRCTEWRAALQSRLVTDNVSDRTSFGCPRRP